MTDSSHNVSSPFVAIRLKSIRTLVRLIRDSTAADRIHIQRRFLEHASDFEATVLFLETLGCVTTNGQSLTLSETIAGRTYSEADLSTDVMQRLRAADCPLRVELFGYIGQFHVVGNQAIYRPMAHRRSAESDLRNFLMELAVIIHDPDLDAYVLNSKYNDLYAESVRNDRPVSPSFVADQIAASTDFGTTIEAAIVSYERRRLGATYAESVKHTALADAAAGYDIESVTVLSPEGIAPRLIEVKAVSATTFSFYWTANEISIARRFGQWYYLYLVPILPSGRPDIDNLRIIPDPCSVVLDAADSWLVTADINRCELRSHESQGSGR